MSIRVGGRRAVCVGNCVNSSPGPLLESYLTRRARRFPNAAFCPLFLNVRSSLHAGHVPPSAILLIVGAVACFSLLDTIVKFLATRYSVPMLVWARYAVQAIAIVLWLGPTMRSQLLRTRQLYMELASAQEALEQHDSKRRQRAKGGSA